MNRLGMAGLAGAVGTLAVGACGPLEQRALHRKPVFAPAALARRLASQVGAQLDAREATVAGLALRAAYGPSWGLALAVAPHFAARRPALAGLALGALVAAFEELALPGTGATPPARSWSSEEHLLLLAQTLAFGLASAFAFRALAARR